MTIFGFGEFGVTTLVILVLPFFDADWFLFNGRFFDFAPFLFVSWHCIVAWAGNCTALPTG